jgi:hypothetical protein
VPTLSFASLSFDKDKLSRKDAMKMQQLQANLSDAREVLYRFDHASCPL